MKKILRPILAGFVLLLGPLALAWPDLQLWLASDSCMGDGGSFDFVRRRCDLDQAHPYVTFGLLPFWGAGIGAVLGIGLIGRGLLGLRNHSLKPARLRGAPQFKC